MNRTFGYENVTYIVNDDPGDVDTRETAACPRGFEWRDHITFPKRPCCEYGSRFRMVVPMPIWIPR